MNKYLFSALVAVLLLAGCVDYNDVTAPADLQVQITKPAEFIHAGNLEGLSVTLTLNNKSRTATTNAAGVAIFSGLVPDIYTVSTSWEVNQADYTALTGRHSGALSYTVSGSLPNQRVFGNTTLTLNTHISANPDIIIGKVYHSGSKDANNRTYQAGKYIELYNQSEQTVDVSGLYIALLESNSTQAWTLGNLNERYADTMLVAKQVFRIPASKAFNVLPGKTVLLVNSAVNHTGNNAYENDLTGADFEAKDVNGRTQNNPATPALEVVYTAQPSISQMNITQGGPCGVAIFRTSEDVSQWQKVYQYGRTSGTQWMLIPIKYVLDGVDILKNRATGVDVNTKRLYPIIDAGYTHSESISGSTGEVLYRKTAKTVNGRKLLQDTNNSTNDFKPSTTIKIRNYDD